MSGPNPDELLATLAPLLEAATPGPWESAAGAPPVAPLRSPSGEVLFSPGPAARPAAPPDRVGTGARRSAILVGGNGRRTG